MDTFFNEILLCETEFFINFLNESFSGPTRSIVLFSKFFEFNERLTTLQTSLMEIGCKM